MSVALPRQAKLLASRDLHAGIALVVDGDLLMNEQEEVLRSLLQVVHGAQEQGRDLVNRVLRGGRTQTWTFDAEPALWVGAVKVGSPSKWRGDGRLISDQPIAGLARLLVDRAIAAERKTQTVEKKAQEEAAFDPPPK